MKKHETIFNFKQREGQPWTDDTETPTYSWGEIHIGPYCFYVSGTIAKGYTVKGQKSLN